MMSQLHAQGRTPGWPQPPGSTVGPAGGPSRLSQPQGSLQFTPAALGGVSGLPPASSIRQGSQVLSRPHLGPGCRARSRIWFRTPWLGMAQWPQMHGPQQRVLVWLAAPCAICCQLPDRHGAPLPAILTPEGCTRQVAGLCWTEAQCLCRACSRPPFRQTTTLTPPAPPLELPGSHPPWLPHGAATWPCRRMQPPRDPPTIRHGDREEAGQPRGSAVQRRGPSAAPRPTSGSSWTMASCATGACSGAPSPLA